MLKRARTNSQFVSFDNARKAYNVYRTSDDYAFRQRYLNDVYLRSYYETKYTWDNHGYVLFLTLTYDEWHVQWVHDMFDFKFVDADEKQRFLGNNNLDFRCFNPTHFKKFMDRLRADLRYHGFSIDGRLKFQYVTEYGTSDTYVDDHDRIRKGTKRPHYHVLFYVTCDQLLPAYLARYVARAWSYGHVDCWDYRFDCVNRKVLEHNTFNPTIDPNRVRGVTYYIAKYMLKDSDYSKLLNKNEPYFMELLLRDNDLIASFRSEFIDKNCKKSWFVYPDSSISISFVEAILGKTFRTVIVDTSLPAYSNLQFALFLKRKLKHYVMSRIGQFHRTSLHFGEYACELYDAEQFIDNPTLSIPDRDKGIKYLPLPRYYVYKFFYTLSKRSNGKYFWLPNEVGERYLDKCNFRKLVDTSERWKNFMREFSSDSPFVRKVSFLLDGRTFEDFVFYKVYFQGIFFRHGVDISEIDYTRNYMPCSEFVDVDKLTGSEVSWIWNDFVLNEDTFFEFRNFDRLDRILTDMYQSFVEHRRQIYYENRELRCKRYKDLGFQLNLQLC